jgi:hypothetical protein
MIMRHPIHKRTEESGIRTSARHDKKVVSFLASRRVASGTRCVGSPVRQKEFPVIHDNTYRESPFTAYRSSTASAKAVLCAVLLSAVLLAPTMTFAQGVITDSDVRFEYNSLPGGSADFEVPTGTDHLFRAWWWYRVSGDPAETSLPAPDTDTYVGNVATLDWADVDGRGFGAHLLVTLIDGGGPSGTVQFELTITNSTGADLAIDIFSYADFDVAGTAGGDSATLIHANDYIQITDGTTSAEFRGFGADAYEVTALDTLRTALDDGGITDLANAGLPFGPADFTGAFQWTVTIPTGDSALFPALFSVDQTAEPLGACCLGPDFCQDTLTPSLCGLAGGTWRGLGSLCPLTACCQVAVYDDQTAFETAFPGLPLEDFEESPVAPGAVLACGTVFDSATNDACFATGDILNGIAIQGVEGGTMAVLGDTFAGSSTINVGPNFGVETLEIVFPNNDVFAVGMDLLIILGTGTLEITVFGPQDDVLAEATLWSDSSGSFFGVSSDRTITRITVLSFTGAKLVDNIQFGGLLDTDGDGFGDACDDCPNDPAKVDPGVCGCGVADDDTDGDGVEDCFDRCPNDPNKDGPGVCGCDVADDDTDGDGVEDCFDGCPNDPNKDGPGVCGCGVADDDTDGDGVPDCNDNCPNDPNKLDPGFCGCGTPDSLDDADDDGVIDCLDNCPDTANPDQADSDGNGVGDACEPPPAGQPAPCGTGCAQGVVMMMPLTVLGIGWMKRRGRVRGGREHRRGHQPRHAPAPQFRRYGAGPGS